MGELLASVTAPELLEMEVMEQYDPSGLERIELAIAQLTSVVRGILSGEYKPPGDLASDWGGLRQKAKRERAVVVDHLAQARERATLE